MSREPEPGLCDAASAGQLSAEERCELLLEIARRSRGTLDLAQILDRLLDAVGTVVDYDAAGIFALSEILEQGAAPWMGKITGVARRGYLERPVADDRMLAGAEGLVGHAIRSGESLLVSDVRRDPRYVVGRRETLSEIVVPIRVDGRAIAALNVESDQAAAFDGCDLERLEFFAAAAAMAIEKAMLHRHLVELEQIDAQLRIAREVQLGLLPRAAPELPGWEIAGLCRPSLELSGDLYDDFPLAGGRRGLVIGDVAGKGVPAALIMTTFRALLRARRDSLCGSGGRGTAPDEAERRSGGDRGRGQPPAARVDGDARLRHLLLRRARPGDRRAGLRELRPSARAAGAARSAGGHRGARQLRSGAGRLRARRASSSGAWSSRPATVCCSTPTASPRRRTRPASRSAASARARCWSSSSRAGRSPRRSSPRSSSAASSTSSPRRTSPTT